MACGRTGSGCQDTQHYSGAQEQSRDQDAGEFAALATRGILVARQVARALRASPAAGDLGMANTDGRAATATAMTTGSMASLGSRVCLKEFVEGVLLS